MGQFRLCDNCGAILEEERLIVTVDNIVKRQRYNRDCVVVREELTAPGDIITFDFCYYPCLAEYMTAMAKGTPKWQGMMPLRELEELTPES